MAVGYYMDRAPNGQAMTAIESGGKWGAATELALPRRRVDRSQVAGCPAEVRELPGGRRCIAVGSYTDANGAADAQAMSVTATGGVFDQAAELVLPANAAASSGAQNASLNAVACVSLGNCSAVGHYVGTNGSPDGEAMGATILTSAGPTGGGGGGGAAARPAAASTGRQRRLERRRGRPLHGPRRSEGVRPEHGPREVDRQVAHAQRHVQVQGHGQSRSFRCALVPAAHGKHRKTPRPSYRGCTSPEDVQAPEGFALHVLRARRRRRWQRPHAGQALLPDHLTARPPARPPAGGRHAFGGGSRDGYAAGARVPAPWSRPRPRHRHRHRGALAVRDVVT